MPTHDYKGRRIRKKTHARYSSDPARRTYDYALCTERAHDLAYLTTDDAEVTCARCKAARLPSKAIPRKPFEDRTLRRMSRDLAEPLTQQERIEKYMQWDQQDVARYLVMLEDKFVSAPTKNFTQRRAHVYDADERCTRCGHERSLNDPSPRYSGCKVEK